MALVQKTLIQACNLVGKPCIITRVVGEWIPRWEDLSLSSRTADNMI